MLFYVKRNDGQGIALCSEVTVEDTDVWTWMGVWHDAIAEPITRGMVIPQWILWDRDNHNRTDLTVVKVNRVTIRVRAEDDGREYVIRIDR